MAPQTAPFHSSPCSACINVFLNECGRHCNDNQGGYTKLVQKCTTYFLPNLPFCYAAHLTFCSAAKAELSPPPRYSPHQYCCDANLGLSSLTASNTMGQRGKRRVNAAQFGAERSLPCLPGQNRHSLIRLLRGSNILPIKCYCGLVGRETKCGPTPR